MQSTEISTSTPESWIILSIIQNHLAVNSNPTIIQQCIQQLILLYNYIYIWLYACLLAVYILVMLGFIYPLCSCLCHNWMLLVCLSGCCIYFIYPVYTPLAEHSTYLYNASEYLYIPVVGENMLIRVSRLIYTINHTHGLVYSYFYIGLVIVHTL